MQEKNRGHRGQWQPWQLAALAESQRHGAKMVFFEGPSGLLIAPSLHVRFGLVLAQYIFVASQHGRIFDFMRWDLAKCEKTWMLLAQNLDPQCSSQASEKHCQGETSKKNDIRLAPLIRSFVISFRGIFFYSVCTGSTNRLRNIATSELALPDKHKTKGKH